MCSPVVLVRSTGRDGMTFVESAAVGFFGA
jgi:hypothetical protein